jgi:NarL family two-component system sensor histidine kinase LiaS
VWTLRWRLTLSYIMVTVIALLTLEGAALGIVDYEIVSNAALSPRTLAYTLQQASPQVAPFLTDPTNQANTQFLQTWIQGRGPYPISPGGLLTVVSVGGNGTLLVMGRQGQVLATWSAEERLAPSVDTIQRMPQTQRLLAAALQGQKDEARLAYGGPNGLAIVAAPVMIGGTVLGALIFATNLQGVYQRIVATTVRALLPSAILLTIIATLVGTLFGILTARGLTRRLRRLTHAAEAWSQGDFAVAVRDRSSDELGQLARDLNRMAEQVQVLLQERQQLAAVEERNRLARDLHDAVKQQVFATSMQLAAARTLLEQDPAAAAQPLAQAERLAAEAQRELTTLIQELRPAALEGKGLVPALREYCAEWSRQTSISAEVRAQGEQPAPLAVEQALFRVAQEALSNIARHSGATAAWLRLSWAEGWLALAIADNGHGFDPEEGREAGVGLHSMRERVEGLGGTFAVAGASAEGGALIEARVPLAAAPSEDEALARPVGHAPSQQREETIS